MDDLSKGKREQVPAAATLHVHDIREPLDALVRESGAQGDRAPRCAGRRPGVGRRPRVRCGGQRARHRQRARGCPPRRRSGGVRVDGRGDLRRMRAAGSRERPVPSALSLRRREARGRGIPRRIRAPLRRAARLAAVRQRLRTTPGSAWRGRRGGDLSRAAARRNGMQDLRRRVAEPRLRLRRGRGPRDRGRARRRRRAGCSTSVPASQRRCWSSTTSAGQPSARTPPPSTRPPGQESSAEACSTVSSPRPTLGFRPETALASGIAMTWESIRSDR